MRKTVCLFAVMLTFLAGCGQARMSDGEAARISGGAGEPTAIVRMETEAAAMDAGNLYPEQPEDPASTPAGEEALAAAALYGDLLPEDPNAPLAEEEIMAILARLGESGLAVTDYANRLAFENAGQIREFLSAPEGLACGIIQLCTDGGLLYTRLTDSRAVLTRVVWRDGAPEISYQTSYALTELALTEDDALRFTCDIPGNPDSNHDGRIEPTTSLRLDLPGAETAP